MSSNETEKVIRTKVGGWKTLSSECVYENPWISIHHETVKTPAGTDGIYGLVHFKSTAVGVFPVDNEGNTWLVKQSRYTLNQFTWEMPAGGTAEGEPPEACAARELEEEVGLRADSIVELMRVHTTDSVADELAIIYLAKGLSQGSQKLEETEDIEVKKMPVQEALNMVYRGEITDGISVAAILRIALDMGIKPDL